MGDWGQDPQLPWIQGLALTWAFQGSWSWSLFSLSSEHEARRTRPALQKVVGSQKKKKNHIQPGSQHLGILTQQELQTGLGCPQVSQILDGSGSFFSTEEKQTILITRAPGSQALQCICLAQLATNLISFPTPSRS